MSTELDRLVEEAHQLWREGKECEMLPYLKKAVQLCKEQKLIKKQIELQNEYSGVLRISGQYDLALEEIEEALSLIRQHFGEENIGYATTLMNKANIFREKKDYFSAEQLMLSSKELFHHLNDSSYAYVGLLNNLSLVYRELEMYETAENLQIEAVELLKDKEEYAVALAITYNNLYEIQKHTGHLASANQNLQKARQILSEKVGKKHPLYSAVLNNLAESHANNREYAQAVELYEEALKILKTAYGIDSSAYQTVKNNYDYICSLSTSKSSSLDSWGSGMNRAKLLAEKLCRDLDKDFPELSSRICLALVGKGSECLGFDDEYSADHDYDTRCLILLDTEDYCHYHHTLQKYFSQEKDRILLQSIDEFYTFYTSYAKGPKTIEEFRQVPEEYLCSATNGMVFLDRLGKFSDIRRRLLNYYPEDFALKKLAYHLNHCAQSGQYNYERMLKRNDPVAAFLALSEFIRHYLHILYILNQSYMPFYKWAQRKARSLPDFGEYAAKQLNHLVLSEDSKRPALLQEMCKELVEILHQKKLSTSQIDFLTYQAEEVRKHIQDETLRAQDSWML